MRLSAIDTGLIMLALMAPVMPGVFAQELVVISFLFLTVRIALSGNLLVYLKEKIVIFIFFSPALSLALFSSPSHLLRFVPISLLLVGFPYRGFQIKPTALAYTSVFVIAYLVTTQFLIALDNPFLVAFRDAWYPIENNVWAYGSVHSLLYGFGEFRAAGVFYNPNVLGLVLVLYFFAYSLLYRRYYAQEKNLIFSNPFYYLLVASLVFSVFLTGSRTALMALIGYLFIKDVRSRSILKIFQNKKSLTLLAIGVPSVGFFLGERVLQGFTDPMGSANIKFRILINYLQNADLVMLFFGGTYDLQFDAEYGYWIGASGFLGMLGWVLIVRLFSAIVPLSRPIVLAMLLMAIGNTVFYGLLTGAIATITLVIACSITVHSKGQQWVKSSRPRNNAWDKSRWPLPLNHYRA